MAFSNFEFLRIGYPELFRLASRAEQRVEENPFAAMAAMQQMMRSMVRRIAGDAGIVVQDSLGDGLLYSLWKRKILKDEMYRSLRELELFDSRESVLVLDLSRARPQLEHMYDFSVWFYRMHVDRNFVPGAFVIAEAGGNSTLGTVREENREEAGNVTVEMDGNVLLAEWRKGLETVANVEQLAYDNGDKYEGQVYRGRKHGQGVYIWTDGTVYSGRWRHDLEHGYGEKLFANGDVYCGYWADGAFYIKKCSMKVFCGRLESESSQRQIA